MTIFKDNRTGYYKARLRKPGGGTTTLTTKATDKNAARRAAKEAGLADLEAAARVGVLTNEAIGRLTTGRAMTVAKAIPLYAEGMLQASRSPQTIEGNIWLVERWMKFAKVEHLPVAAVTEAHIYDFVNRAGEAGIGTRKVNLAILRSFFTFCAHRRWSGNPAALVGVSYDGLSHEQKERKQVQSFTAAEVKRLLAHFAKEANIFWQFATMLSNETGLRLGDIAQLEWACFSKQGKITVWTDKRNKRVDDLPLSEDLQELLAKVPVLHERYAFPEQRQVYLDHARRAGLSMQFSRHCAACGIEGKSFHSLRHGFVKEQRRLGRTDTDIAVMVGHSSPITTGGYGKG